jgi:hypothetical protein
MNCCDSPWLLAVWAFCFVIIINVKIGLTLPVISNFVPVGDERNVKEHVALKYCRTWRGLKDCVISRANGPCRIVKVDNDVIRGYCLGHIKFDVRNICARTWCKRSKIAFACGFFNVVGLRLIPYVLHKYSKFSLNSLPLLQIINDILGIYSTMFC